MLDFAPLPRPARLLLIALGTIACLPVITGCGEGRPKRVPVAGQVLIDGRPLTFGYVNFVPEHGRASTAKLDNQGHFTLSCYGNNDGVVIGKHAIEVVAREAIGEIQFKWHAPKKYASVGTSELSEEITTPIDSLKINLTWGKEHGPFIEQPM